MINYFLITVITALSFVADKMPEGWKKIKTEKVGERKFEVYFFDYFTRLQKDQPDIFNYKGTEFTNRMQVIHDKYPLYVFKTKEKDSLVYFILRTRPSASKDTPFWLDIDIIKSSTEYGLDRLEDRINYLYELKKTIPAKTCRGGLVYEYSLIIQNNPDKKKLIGGGVAITEGIFTSVLSYEETKKQFFASAEAELTLLSN
jgi:hypothetical protein